MGQVCAQSRPFNFCIPKPLEELETLKEEEDEGDGEEELLLVVPRAQLLQVRTRTETVRLTVSAWRLIPLRTESTGRVPKKTGGDPAGAGRDRNRSGEREGERQESEGGVGAGERRHEGGDLQAQRQHERKFREAEKDGGKTQGVFDL